MSNKIILIILILIFHRFETILNLLACTPKYCLNYIFSKQMKKNVEWSFNLNRKIIFLVITNLLILCFVDFCMDKTKRM